MISKIRIENFKNFKEFEFDGFKQINLVAGQNNVGKTNLLEAIYLGQQCFDPTAVLNSFILRREIVNTEKYFGLDLVYRSKLFDDLALKIFGDLRKPVSISIDGIEEKLFLQPIPVGSIVSNSDFKLEINPEIRDYFIKFDTRIPRDSKKIGQPFSDFHSFYFGSLLNKPNLSWVPSYSLNTFNEDQFQNLKFNGLDEKFYSCLSKFIPDLTEIYFFDQHQVRVPKFRIKGSKNWTSISDVGFGSNRILEVVSGLFLASGGILFLDEADLGIHYSQLEKFWTVLFELSSELDQVQIFATTHSKDCFDAFANVAIEKKNFGIGKFLRLEKKVEKIEVVEYSEDSAFRATQINTEVR